MILFTAFIIICSLQHAQGYITSYDAYSLGLGDKAELQCTSNNKNAKLVWFKNENQIVHDIKYIMKESSTESVLEIRRVDELNLGVHVCKDTVSEESRKVNLFVPAGAQNGTEIIKQLGETVRIECKAYGYPVPEVRWFKNSAPITNSGRIYAMEDRPTLQPDIILKNGTLKFDNAQASDSGVYSCNVRNTLGEQLAYTRVTVGEKNTPTMSLSTSKLESNSPKLESTTPKLESTTSKLNQLLYWWNRTLQNWNRLLRKLQLPSE